MLQWTAEPPASTAEEIKTKASRRENFYSVVVLRFFYGTQYHSVPPIEKDSYLI
jgi:hypothetical protein